MSITRWQSVIIHELIISSWQLVGLADRQDGLLIEGRSAASANNL